MINLNGKNLCENCFSPTGSGTCESCGFSPEEYVPDPTVLAVGAMLQNRYRIGGIIGKGGFGVTYIAYDTKLERRIAVKEYFPYGLALRDAGSTSVMTTGDADVFKKGAEKFYDEARLIAKFNSSGNIVNVYDVFYENDTVYYAMEYLRGETLKTYVENSGRLTPGQAVYIAGEVADALGAAHEMNVVHRDISPDNIMLCPDNKVKLIDFGAARQVVSENSQSLSVILTQGFAPLEQYQKKGKQGPWTDIYSLGASIYYGLTGEIIDDPMSRFEDDSAFQANPHSIEAELWGIIRKAAAIKIGDRYQSAAELRDALGAISIRPEKIFIAPDKTKIKAVSVTASRTGITSEQPESMATQPVSQSSQMRTMPVSGSSQMRTEPVSQSSQMRTMPVSDRSQMRTMPVNEVTPPQESEDKPEKKRRIPIIAGIAAGIVLIAVIIIIAVNSGGDDDDITVDESVTEAAATTASETASEPSAEKSSESVYVGNYNGELSENTMDAIIKRGGMLAESGGVNTAVLIEDKDKVGTAYDFYLDNSDKIPGGSGAMLIILNDGGAYSFMVKTVDTGGAYDNSERAKITVAVENAAENGNITDCVDAFYEQLEYYGGDASSAEVSEAPGNSGNSGTEKVTEQPEKPDRPEKDESAPPVTTTAAKTQEQPQAVRTEVTWDPLKLKFTVPQGYEKQSDSTDDWITYQNDDTSSTLCLGFISAVNFPICSYKDIPGNIDYLLDTILPGKRSNAQSEYFDFGDRDAWMYVFQNEQQGVTFNCVYTFIDSKTKYGCYGIYADYKVGDTKSEDIILEFLDSVNITGTPSGLLADSADLYRGDLGIHYYDIYADVGFFYSAPGRTVKGGDGESLYIQNSSGDYIEIYVTNQSMETYCDRVGFDKKNIKTVTYGDNTFDYIIKESYSGNKWYYIFSMDVGNGRHLKIQVDTNDEDLTWTVENNILPSIHVYD